MPQGRGGARHGARAGPDIDALLSPEPALRDHKRNYERAHAIEYVRRYVRENVDPGSRAHAKISPVLGRLRPDSRPELWYLLCDLLRGELGSPHEELVEGVLETCLRALRDIATSGTDDRGMTRALGIVTERRGKNPKKNITWFDRTLRKLSRYLESERPGPSMHAYVVGLAQSGSEHKVYAATRILDIIYARRGMHGQAHCVCAELVRQKAGGKKGYLDPKVVELTMIAVLGNIAKEGTLEENKGLIGECLATLEQRAADLGVDVGTDRGDHNELRAAFVLAYDVLERRRLQAPRDIESWILATHPLAHSVLGLGPRKVSGSVKAKSPFARHVSAAMRHPHSAALAHLEAMLALGRHRGALPEPFPSGWKARIVGGGLWDALFEISLHARFRLSWGGHVGRDPAIEHGKSADLEVNGCHIEAYAPHGGVIPFGQFLSDEQADYGMARTILQKPQLDHFGKRQSVLMVKCPPIMLDNAKLRCDLAKGIVSRPQLGGIVLVAEMGMECKSRFLWNWCASTPVSQQNTDLIKGALDYQVVA